MVKTKVSRKWMPCSNFRITRSLTELVNSYYSAWHTRTDDIYRIWHSSVGSLRLHIRDVKTRMTHWCKPTIFHSILDTLQTNMLESNFGNILFILESNFDVIWFMLDENWIPPFFEGRSLQKIQSSDVPSSNQPWLAGKSPNYSWSL